MLRLLRLKTALKTVVLPPGGLILLSVLGVFLLNRRPRLARVCVALGLGSLWLLSTPLVADGLTKLTEHYPPVDGATVGPTVAQAIVILGGGGQRKFAPEYGGAAAEPVMLERLSYGAYLARKTQLPVLVTGWHIEADAMSETLQRIFGITPRWVDDAAYDTFQNATNSVRLLQADGIKRILLVTNSTHMWRSVHEFTAAGIDVVPAPTGMRTATFIDVLSLLPNCDALARSQIAINEMLGEQVRRFLAATHLRHHG